MSTQTKKLKSEFGFQTAGFSVANGLLQVNNLDTDSFITNSLEITGTSTYLSVNNGIITINSAAGSPGTINNMNIGVTTPANAIFTTLNVTSTLIANPAGNVSIAPTGTVTINPGTVGVVDNLVIGATTPRAATFTTATSTNLSSTTGAITTLTSNLGTITTLTSTTGNITTVTSTNITTTNMTVNNNLTVDSITADEIVINNAPSGPTNATRKDYVDATATALAIALGA